MCCDSVLRETDPLGAWYRDLWRFPDAALPPPLQQKRRQLFAMLPRDAVMCLTYMPCAHSPTSETSFSPQFYSCTLLSVCRKVHIFMGVAYRNSPWPGVTRMLSALRWRMLKEERGWGVLEGGTEFRIKTSHPEGRGSVCVQIKESLNY